MRLYLSLHRPSSFAADFTYENFNKFSSDLTKQLQQLDEYANLIVSDEIGNVLPQKLIDCNRATRNMELFMSPANADLRRAGRELMSFIDLTIQSIGSGNASERLMLLTLGVLMAPFMPIVSKRLLHALNINSCRWVRDWATAYAII